MFCVFKSKFELLKKIDMFGKEANLYIEGKEKKTSCFGTVLSIIYITLYLLLISYKLSRMINKKDVIFYDTFIYMDQPPSIKITKDNFYGGFALENPKTYDPLIDETIYYPKAYFKRAHRNGENWIFEVKDVELERCKIENFGKNFQNKIITHSLSNLYCFKEMDEILEGHFSYDVYSFFYIEFYPCKNSTENNNKCQPIENINYYLNNTFLSFQMEDVQLTPDNYRLPVLPRNHDIYFIVGKRLFMEVHVFFQIVSIETDMDIIGLEQFQNFKVDKYLRYDSQVQMTNFIENNIYETGESFCSVTIKLSDLVRVQRRSYSNLLSVLESVGGTMEVIFLLFKISSYFITAILYELDIVNILFKFNIDKKTIIIKNNKHNFESKYRIVNRSGSTKAFSTYYKKFDNSSIPFTHKKRISVNEQMCTKPFRFSKFQIIPKDEPATAIRLKNNNKDKEKDNSNSKNIIIKEVPEENNISFDYMTIKKRVKI